MSDGTNESISEQVRFGLTKMMLCLAAIFLASRAFASILAKRLIGAVPDSLHFVETVNLMFPANALFAVVGMGAILLLYRPVSELFRPISPGASAGSRPMLVGGLVGASAGMLMFLVGLPILGSSHPRVFVHSFFPAVGSTKFWPIAALVVLCLMLPVASEMVFRGIVQRTLEYHTALPAAILASALAQSVTWPTLLNFPLTIVLGSVNGYLFHKRGLFSSVISSVSFSTCALIYILWKIFS